MVEPSLPSIEPDRRIARIIPVTLSRPAITG